MFETSFMWYTLCSIYTVTVTYLYKSRPVCVCVMKNDAGGAAGGRTRASSAEQTGGAEGGRGRTRDCRGPK